MQWLDLGARNHDPTLGRFMNLDPLAEDYVFQSTYAFAANNPVYFIDINGEGVKTDFKLDKKTGKTTRVDESDGSEENDYDRLYSTDDEGNVNDDDYVQIDKEKSTDKSILTDLSKIRTNKINLDQKRSISLSDDMSDAFKVFKFAAENSDVEWSLYGLKMQDGAQRYFLGTQFNNSTGVNFFEAGLFSVNYSLDAKSMLFDLHSHPRTRGGSSGDLNRVGELQKRYGVPTTMDKFYVYHAKTKTLVKYSRHKSNVFEKPINSHTDFYTGKTE